jgi:hypothetical protein
MKYLMLAAGLALAGLAHAGHEFPFYPSYYPQEITVEALDAQAAAERVAKGTLHGYAGGELGSASVSAKTGAVQSLGGYVVLTFDRRAAQYADRAGRCAAARSFKDGLAPGQIWHPYPVTPFHADYLHHADRAEAARAAIAVQTIAKPVGQIEIIDTTALMTQASARYNGWIGPPWLRQGWYHAYLLLAPAVSDAAARARIEEAARRLMRGERGELRERIARERALVALLQNGCERIVLGYIVRREHFGKEYSQGIENVGYDALDGLASAIFPRTVKLRDFPWNGWLNVAAPSAPSSPWNPVAGGFEDAFGRLVWWALADPAFLPSPHAGGWIENRVSVSDTKTGSPLAIPEDAFLPEAGSGRLVPAGRGKTATARIVYRVRNSKFHDGTPMNVADLFYAYAFAAAWGAGNAADPGVAQATALAQEKLRGVRLLRVERESLAFGEDKLSYDVPVMEVYLDAGAAGDAATIAPPWTIVPWHLLALLDEGARRGYFAFSPAGAKLRGVPELDPVRDAGIVRQLAKLVRELEGRAHVPAALARYVRADEARQRYRRLREFHAAHGHWLVTNGPYKLNRWDTKKAVLGVFRDPTYPKGLGSFNAFAAPLKAYVKRVERRDYGAEIHTEIEWLEQAGRDVKIVRGSFAKRLAEQLTTGVPPPSPVCRFVLLGSDGAVAAAGAVRAQAAAPCRLEWKRPAGPAGPGGARLVLGVVLGENVANAPIMVIPWQH